MIYTIGAGVGADFNIDDANYDKSLSWPMPMMMVPIFKFFC